MITIENINGRDCTVIRKPFDAEWVGEQLAMGIPVIAWHRFWRKPTTIVNYYTDRYGNIFYYGCWDKDTTFTLLPMVFESVLTILPALPRHPKPEDAPLIYRYMAEGLNIAVRGLLERRAVHGWFVCFNSIQKYWELKSEVGHYSQAVDHIEITHAIYQGNRVDIALKD